MSNLGPITVPVPPVIGPFPLKPDFGTAEEIEPLQQVHRFDSPGLKTEQRFWRGVGSRRFRVRRAYLACQQYEDLRDHWNQARGLYASFPYNHPHQDGTTEQVMVHYAEPVLHFDYLVSLLTGDPGIVLIESKDAATPVPYTISRTEDGVPSSQTLTDWLRSEQELMPLVVIQPLTGSTPLYLADRSVIIGGNEYLARLLDWGGLTQSTDGNNDAAEFHFGNADGIWTQLFKSVSLRRARLSFAIYDLKTGTLLSLWQGTVREWSIDPGTKVISIRASEGLYELTLAYPTRQISRTCWKEFKSPWCPYQGPLTTCDKSWEQCQERGMILYFGGMVAKPQTVRIADNSTGTWGWGRSQLKSVSIADESIYQRVLQEIYTDLKMVVNCDVAMGRDESEFYSALGIVGEGPLTGFGTDLTKHLLDGQPCHDPKNGGGWRASLGRDPAATAEFFGLSQAPWDQVPANSTYASGTALAEIRRTDEKGLQLSKVSDRKMQVTVAGGRGGWTWTAPGNRWWTEPLTNPVWIAVNVFLRGIGLKSDYARDMFSTSLMEDYLRIQPIIDAAAICELQVPVLVGAGNERQFPFRGTLREQKPLRDWISEILMTCLGYSYYLNGRLGIGIRVNASATSAFTVANVLENSFVAEPREPAFNHLTAEFADEEYNFDLNTIQVYDIDAARLEGSYNGPRFRPTRMSLAGVSNKSQASRLAITRLKEELGGATVAEQQQSRGVKLRTTIIGIGIMPGDVCSYTDSSLPTGIVHFRVTRRTLNPDWSMDFEGTPVTASMYDVDAGPKPDDVVADPVPPERFQSQRGMAWLPNAEEPVENDPIYYWSTRSFKLWQDYTIETEGTYSPALVVRGERTVNQFLSTDASLINHVTWSQTGGTLPGGNTYYFAVTQRDSAGHYAQISNTVAVWLPPGSDTYQVTLSPIQVMDASLPGYCLFMGTDPRRMIEQTNDALDPLPSSITVTGWIERLGRGMPTGVAKAIRIKCKEVQHSGVAGLEVQQVIAPNKIVSSEFKGSDDPWVGQVLSVIADVDEDGSVPLWNFTITAFDNSTGTLTLNPDCVRATATDSVQPGDVMIVRSRATAADAGSITNSMWKNSVGANQFGAIDGLIPGAEVELHLRIIGGKGAGQVRRIVNNTNLRHDVDPPFTVVPDTTSIYIIEYADWVYAAETSVVPVPLPGEMVEIGARVPNLTGNVALVGGFLLDDEGTETAEELAVYREIYLYGQPYDVRRTSAKGTDISDQTLRVDTTAGDVEVDLTAAGQYFGRTMLIVNDGTGATPGRVLVKTTGSDTFTTTETEVILEKPSDWCEFVAAGDPVQVASLARNRRHPVWNWAGRRSLQPPRRKP